MRPKGNSFAESLKKGASFTARVMKHAAGAVVEVRPGSAAHRCNTILTCVFA